LKHLGCTALSLGDCGEYEVTQELGVVILEDSGLDRHRTYGAPAIGGYLDHAAAGRRFDGTVGQLALELLQATLHLLPELKELLKVCHAIG